MLMIDKFSGKPVYEQLIEGIERDILTGIYAEGSQLPSVRELSSILSVNPNTIQKSYAELMRRGIVRSALGSGCYVTPDAKAMIRREAAKRLEELRALVRELRCAGVDALDIVTAATEAANEKQEIEQGGTHHDRGQ